MAKKSINWDALGIASSLACAVHCAILPLVMVSLPVFGINIIHNWLFELMMIFIALCVGSISLVHGYRKHHNRLLPLCFFCIGICLLFSKQFWHGYEMEILPFAVIFICLAHLTNMRLNRLAKSQFT